MAKRKDKTEKLPGSSADEIDRILARDVQVRELGSIIASLEKRQQKQAGVIADLKAKLDDAKAKAKDLQRDISDHDNQLRKVASGQFLETLPFEKVVTSDGLRLGKSAPTVDAHLAQAQAEFENASVASILSDSVPQAAVDALVADGICDGRALSEWIAQAPRRRKIKGVSAAMEFRIVGAVADYRADHIVGPDPAYAALPRSAARE